MIDVEPTLFDLVCETVWAEYPNADIADRYIHQPSAFPHVQAYLESDTTNRNGMNLSGDECFSNHVLHIEIFDNDIVNGKETVKRICNLLDPVLRLRGYRRTYKSPVPNYDEASINRLVVRYSKLQAN